MRDKVFIIPEGDLSSKEAIDILNAKGYKEGVDYFITNQNEPVSWNNLEYAVRKAAINSSCEFCQTDIYSCSTSNSYGKNFYKETKTISKAQYDKISHVESSSEAYRLLKMHHFANSYTVGEPVYLEPDYSKIYGLNFEGSSPCKNIDLYELASLVDHELSLDQKMIAANKKNPERGIASLSEVSYFEKEWVDEKTRDIRRSEKICSDFAREQNNKIRRMCIEIKQESPNLEIKYEKLQLIRKYDELNKPSEQIKFCIQRDCSEDENLEIFQGFDNGLTAKQIELYADPKFNERQMEQMRLGLEHGISDDKIKLYFSPSINAMEMEIVRIGLEKDFSLERIELLKDFYKRAGYNKSLEIIDMMEKETSNKAIKKKIENEGYKADVTETIERLQYKGIAGLHEAAQRAVWDLANHVAALIELKREKEPLMTEGPEYLETEGISTSVPNSNAPVRDNMEDIGDR
jgi:hypothetical protein